MQEAIGGGRRCCAQPRLEGEKTLEPGLPRGQGVPVLSDYESVDQVCSGRVNAPGDRRRAYCIVVDSEPIVASADAPVLELVLVDVSRAPVLEGQ